MFTRSAVWLGALALPAVAVYLLLSVYTGVRQETIRQWETQQSTLAREICRGLKGFFGQLDSTLTYMAENRHISSLDQRGKELMAGFHAFHKNTVKAITRIDNQGRIVYTWPVNPKAIGKDVSGQEHNAQIMRHHRPVLSDVFRAVQGYRAVAYAVPVFRGGSYRGCLTLLIPFQAIAAAHLRDIRLGQGEQAWVLSQKGKLIYRSSQGPGAETIKQRVRNLSPGCFISRMLKGGSGAGALDCLDPAGPDSEEMRAVFESVDLGNTFWSVAIAAPESKILGVMRGFTVKWLLIVGLLALAGLAGSYYVIRTRAVLAETRKRQQAEKALRQTEQRFKAIFDSTFQFTGLMTPDGRIIEANRAALHLAGVELEQVIGRLFWETEWWNHDARQAQKVKEAVGRAASGEFVRFEVEHLAYDGRPVVADFSLKPIFDEQGEVVLILPEGRDITDRKQADQALKESELQYRSLFNAAHDAIVIFRGDMVLDCNPRAEELLGRSRDMIVGPYRPEYNPEIQPDGEPSQKKRQKIVELALAGKPQHYEWQYLHAGGVTLDAEVSMSRLDLAGVPHLLAIIRDVSERKKAERELALSEARLQHAQAMAHVGSWEFDPIADRLWFSQETMRIYGLHGEDGFLDTARIMGVIHPEDILRREEAMEALLREDRPYDLEIRVIKADDGQVRHIRSKAVAERDSKGRAIKVLGSLQDITEQKTALAEKARLEASLRQSQKMEALGTLAGGIAHDFNNILSALMGYTELAMMNQPPGHEVRSMLGKVLQAGNRAKELVGQILAFSRQTSQEMKPLQVSPLLKEVLHLLRSSLPASIEIQQEIDAPGAVVMGDASQMHQVVMNLCVNAAAAMEESGGELKVSLREATLTPEEAGILLDIQPGRYLLLEVGDTGTGIDPAIREKIFEPYFTTKRTGEGTGLGLAVVHGIVKEHGGAITVHSEPGQGSVFTVYLPLVEPESEAQVPADDSEVPGGHETILFVDDEQALIEVSQGLLETLGYRVRAYTSSREALKAFRADPEAFDLVITDMNMPEMDGRGLTREILAIRHDIPVIVSTGFSQKVSEQEIAGLGIKKLLMKPVLKHEFGLAVREVLDGGPSADA